jgi:phosphate:Na+ symporter
MTPFINMMVIKLNKMFIERDGAVSTPKYITEALLGDATSSTVALRKEIDHLYENSMEIFAHALSLHRNDIRSEVDMRDIVLKSKQKIDTNIDELYKNRVKVLYDAIIEFSTKSQSNMSDIEIKHIFALKIATRDIVEAVKDMKDLQVNMDKYAFSSNEYIKTEYNLIRENIGNLLRKVEKIRKSPEDATLLTKFIMLKKAVESSDALINGTVDRLIRENKIAPSMGTSLMNDSAFAYDIGLKIIDAIEIIFIENNQELAIIYRELVENLEDESK